MHILCKQPNRTSWVDRAQNIRQKAVEMFQLDRKVFFAFENRTHVEIGKCENAKMPNAIVHCCRSCVEECCEFNCRQGAQQGIEWVGGAGEWAKAKSMH